MENKIEHTAEIIANGIMIGVQANKYHTNVYDTSSNDFNHSHLKRAAKEGYEQAEKDNNLTWEDIERIVLLTDETARLSWFFDKKLQGRELYEKVLEKFNKEKAGCYETTED
jgi:hypothetical protein